MKIRHQLFFITIIFITVLTAGCTDTSVRAADDNYITITDDTGTLVTMPKYPQRIISLAPSVTELFFAVNKENSGAELVGRTAYDTYPPEALLVESVGGMTTGTNIESIISKDPDLIIATTMVDMTMIDQLRDNGYPVILFQIDTIEDIFENIAVVGTVLNETKSAEELTEKLHLQIDEVANRPRQEILPKTMYAVSADPMYVTGSDTYLNELIELAGGENIYSDTQGYFVATTESIIMRQPDVIIVIDGVMNDGVDMREQILLNKELSDVPAVKSGRVYSVDDDLISRPGPRIGEALEILYQCINDEKQ